jgi:lipoprotein LpqH
VERVKRASTVVVAGTILLAGLSGCSSDKPGTGGSGPSSSAATATSGTGAPGPSSSAPPGGTEGEGTPPTVIIDGKNQNITAAPVCRTIKGTVNISIGGSGVGIAAKLTDGNPPQVKLVNLGTLDGVPYSFNSDTANSGNATATKNGNAYKITGNAAGRSPDDKPTTTLKPFEIDATCS